MFPAALFTTAKDGSKGSVHQQMNVLRRCDTHTHTQEHYTATKKNESLLFIITQMKLNGIMLSEKSQRQTLYDITYTWSQKSETGEYNKKRNTLIKRTN